MHIWTLHSVLMRKFYNFYSHYNRHWAASQRISIFLLFTNPQYYHTAKVKSLWNHKVSDFLPGYGCSLGSPFVAKVIPRAWYALSRPGTLPGTVKESKTCLSFFTDATTPLLCWPCIKKSRERSKRRKLCISNKPTTGHSLQYKTKQI